MQLAPHSTLSLACPAARVLLYESARALRKSKMCVDAPAQRGRGGGARKPKNNKMMLSSSKNNNNTMWQRSKSKKK